MVRKKKIYLYRYILFKDKFHMNECTDVRVGKDRVKGGKGEEVAEAFDFNSREDSCMS